VTTTETGTVKMEYVTVGATIRGSFDRSLAALRAHGCTVTYADKDRGWFSTTYYNLKVQGPAPILRSFVRWVNELND
jgi:hypothetical protein